MNFRDINFRLHEVKVNRFDIIIERRSSNCIPMIIWRRFCASDGTCNNVEAREKFWIIRNYEELYCGTRYDFLKDVHDGIIELKEEEQQ